MRGWVTSVGREVLGRYIKRYNNYIKFTFLHASIKPRGPLQSCTVLCSVCLPAFKGCRYVVSPPNLPGRSSPCSSASAKTSCSSPTDWRDKSSHYCRYAYPVPGLILSPCLQHANSGSCWNWVTSQFSLLCKTQPNYFVCLLSWMLKTKII